MRIFIFKSEARRDLRAFTADPGGEKLPSKLGPWHAIGVIKADKDPPFNVRRDVIEQAVNSTGFQLFRMKPKGQATGSSRDGD